MKGMIFYWKEEVTHFYVAQQQKSKRIGFDGLRARATSPPFAIHRCRILHVNMGKPQSPNVEKLHLVENQSSKKVEYHRYCCNIVESSC